MRLRLNNVKAVLFDLDGTLLDSAPDLSFAANQLRIRRGKEALPMSAYRPFVGTGARGMVRIALSITPEDESFEDLKEEFFQAYEACMGQNSQLFDGVDVLLTKLVTQNIPWGIVTNKAERFTLPIVNAVTQFSSAGALVCGDTTMHSKPHPLPLQEAAKRLGVPTQQCVYVGDDERDIQAARAAGMQSVAAAYGYLGGVETLTAWQPDFIINSPTEISGLLDLD